MSSICSLPKRPAAQALRPWSSQLASQGAAQLLQQAQREENRRRLQILHHKVQGQQAQPRAGSAQPLIQAAPGGAAASTAAGPSRKILQVDGPQLLPSHFVLEAEKQLRC